MRAQDFEYLYNLEERFWWFVSMREIVDAIIAQQLSTRGGLRMLDAGCGTGFNLRHYAMNGRNDVYGLDIAAEAVDGVRKRGFSKVAQASVSEIPFASSVFDFVFSFDVLSQVPPELSDACLREMQRVLRPGGYLFIRAPAFEWMRSSHDEELHTLHRFGQQELVQKLIQAGFKIQRSTYANTFLFPVVVVRRFLKLAGIGRGTDVRPLPAGLGWLDPIFRRILGAEATVLRWGGRLPFGLSVICYAQKSGT